MKQIVIDIETARFPFDSLSESQQEFLLRDSNKIEDLTLREEKAEEAKRFMNLYPLTAKAVVIGMYIVEKKRSFVLYEADAETEKWENELGDSFKGMPEKEMLILFWDYIKQFETVITFNGRKFDIPFLLLRSALNGIRPTRDLMGYRYEHKKHCDLLDQLSFYGNTKMFNLDFYCHAFGIHSPKSGGITGWEVQEFYEAGKIREIAEYCARDIVATYKLYELWEQYLKF